jgi:acyl transferase domain-containing protein/surfactin synthase thioesterase subunit
MTTEKLNELLKKSLLEVQRLRTALRQSEAASVEPIAIVGMACRTPGGAMDPEAYWDLLREERDVVRPLPARFQPERIYDPEPSVPGKTYAREAGALDDVDQFDASFFAISPREASAMDPQQRMTLEVSWEALERAGMRPLELNESRTGVYLGAIRADYGQQDPALESLDGYRGTGVANSVLAGRISYVLGLQGPAIAVDTACSSSLVALHLACAGLRLKECDLALAGGVMIMSTPSLLVEFARLGASSPDGRCRAFSSDANGAGWAEGCGVLVLKRLSDAQRDQNRILAVMRGSAVNQDGRSQGLTAPNGPSQARMLRRALEVSHLSPHDIDAIEAHGTGTPLGDPIEAGALAEVFGPERHAQQPLWLGSAKSNIGHTQAAAGVLGVIKMVLALQHERLPKTLHAENPSPHVAWADSGLKLLQASRAWLRSPSRVRRAGVSSFGISGTNAHVIVEEAPLPAASAARVEPQPAGLPLLLSGRDTAALESQAARWAAWLEAHPHVSWSQVVRSAAVDRTHFKARASIAVAHAEDAVAALRAVHERRAHAALSLGQARRRPGVVFVFSGQGSQWAAMGRTLLVESEIFVEVVRACDAALRPHTGWSVTAVLEGDPSAPSLERIDVLQPALFTMGVALAAVWRSLGVEPAALVGHSQGEIAAAVVSGALSLEDAACVIALRSRLQQRLSGTGAMVFVGLPVEDVTQRLAEPRWSQLSVAVVNTESSSVLAGTPEAVAAWIAYAEHEGFFCRRVASDVAGHTAHMDPLLSELRQRIANIMPRHEMVPMVSTVTGQKIAGELLEPDYWCRNVREPVRLDRALSCLLGQGFDTFLEISPHPVLGIPLTESCGTGGVVAQSLCRDQGGLQTLLASLGLLHVEGLEVDWSAIAGKSAAHAVALPTYAFQRQRYWLDLPDLASSSTPAPGSPGADALRGSRAQPALALAVEELTQLAPAARADRVRALVIEGLRSVLKLAPDADIPETARPLDLGMNSLMGVELARLLKARAGLTLQASHILQAGTVQAMVDYVLHVGSAPLAQNVRSLLARVVAPKADAGSWLVALQQPEQPIGRLICFPYSGAGAAIYRSWRAGLPADLEIWAVELPGRGQRYGQPCAESLSEILEGVSATLSKLPELPLMIFGHSLGAILGFELTRHWLARGRAVDHLFVSGASAPQLFMFPQVTRLSDSALLETLDQLGLSGLGALQNDPELVRMALEIMRSDLKLVADYTYTSRARIATRVTAFSAGSDEIAPFSAVDAWRDVAQTALDFHHHHYSGGHAFIESERTRLLAAISEVVEAKRAEASVATVLMAPPRDDHCAAVVVLLGAGQSAADFAAAVAAAAAAGVEVLIYTPPGQGDRADALPLRRMEALAALVETELSAITSELVLFGHFVSAHLALEVARRRAQRGLPVAHLVVSGSVAPRHMTSQLRITGAAPSRPPTLAAGAPVDPRLARALDAERSRALHYRPQPDFERCIEVPLTLIVARDDEVVAAAAMVAWERVTRASFQRLDVEGGHTYFRQQPERFARLLCSAVTERERTTGVIRRPSLLKEAL